MSRTVAAALALAVGLALAPVAGATTIVLGDGTRLEGEVVGHDRTRITLRVAVRESSGGGTIEGTAVRPIRWTDVATIDGLSIADWLRAEGAAEPASGDPEAVGDAAGGGAREVLARFETWLEEGEGFGTVFRLGALLLLVVAPAVLTLLAARALRVGHVERFRAFGAALLSLGGAAALLRTAPLWTRGWPLGPLGAAALLSWVVLRPPPGRGVALVLVQLGGLAGAVAAVLAVAGRLP